MYGYISQPRVAMVLAAVEESLYSNKVEMLPVPKGLSIERVMPQNWAEHWPLPSDLSSEELETAEAIRRAHLHLLGNLTLMTLPPERPPYPTPRGRSNRRSSTDTASCSSTHG